MYQFQASGSTYCITLYYYYLYVLLCLFSLRDFNHFKAMFVHLSKLQNMHLKVLSHTEYLINLFKVPLSQVYNVYNPSFVN